MRERMPGPDPLKRHRELVRLAKQIRLLQGRDLTFDEIAREVSVPVRELKQTMRSAAFRRLQEQVAKPEAQPLADAADVPTVVKEAKAELALDTIEYYRDCYQRLPEEQWNTKGKWVDPTLAQWAAERIGKGIGLLEPEQMVRPIITIHLGAMSHVLGQVAEEDARVMQAIDVTPSPER